MSLFLEDQEVKDLCNLLGNAEDIIRIAQKRTNDLFLKDLEGAIRIIINWIHDKNTESRKFAKGWKESQEKDKNLFGPQ